MYFGMRSLFMRYGRREVLSGLDLEVRKGEMLVVIGRNGSGKSTLMKAAASSLAPSSGEIVLLDRPVKGWKRRELAKRMAYLPQLHSAPPDTSVRALVACGRYPHIRPGWGMTAADRTAVEEAIRVTGLAELADRPLGTLSGGERQRAWIAMAVCQEPELLLLDEPTTHLDAGCQVEVLELIRRLKNEKGMTVVMVLHDLNLAARYADNLAVLAGGRITDIGRPEDIMTDHLLRDVFGLRAVVLRDGGDGSPYYLPAGCAAQDHRAETEAS